MRAIISTALVLTASYVAATTFSSTTQRTALIELYSSEGCSSCPPSEKRMNAFAEHPGLWTDFVPVAFHVDYWNYMGWHDRFSKPEFTARQRQYSKQWKSRTIFTPCFVVNGKTSRFPTSGKSTDRPGLLKANVEGTRIKVTFTPANPSQQKLKAWVAPLSGKETSDVNSGENRGRKLEHRFVALGLLSENMKFDGDTHAATLQIAQIPGTMAIAVWVSGVESLEPIQATGGWLDSRE